MRKNRKRAVSGLLGAVMFGTAVLTAAPLDAFAAQELTAGGYELDMENVPMVHFSEHKDWETLYRTAWDSHKSNIKAVTKGLNPELTTDEVQSYYVDEAFDNRIFQWDTLFMMLFDKYGVHEFPTLNSMDNFYYHQYDTEDDSDGYISRIINESNGESWYKDYMTVDAINPPLFAWAEWEQYKIHGDVSRFTKVIKGKTIIERLDSYYRFLKRTRTHQSGPAEGLYVSNGQGNGLDNTPNQSWSGWGQAANDMSLQQVQAAGYISRIAGEILKKDSSLTEEEREKYKALEQKYASEEQELKQLIQEKLWSEEGSFFFNIDSSTGEFTNIATPTGLWALAAGVATQEQADRMIEAYALNSNKMFRPNGLSSVCYDYQTFKPTGGYWNGAMWSPTSYQWIKGLQQYGYDELAFEEAVRHVNALADVCVNGAYDRYGNFLNTLWENYSSEYSIPGSTENADTEPSRSNFVGWAGALGIGTVIEELAGITVDGNENAVDWNIKLTEAFGVDNIYFNGPEGENFVSLSCEKRVSGTSGAKIAVKADHGFELRVTVAGHKEVIQVQAGEHSYTVEGTDGEESCLGIKASRNVSDSFTRENLESADSAVLFGNQGNSTKTDGVPNQIEKGNGKIFNVNTVGYYRTNSKYPTELKDSPAMQTLGTDGAKEYVKTTSPSGAEGFMFMVPASNKMQTVKALVGVKNGTARVEADILDASQVTKTAELESGKKESVYEVEIPYCASGDTDMMVTVTMAQNSGTTGEISLKAIVLEDGGERVLDAPEQVTVESEDRGLTVNASVPDGVGYDSYRVYYKAMEEEGYQVKEAAELPCRLENLKNYTRYDVFVTGIKGGVESSDSQLVSQIPEEVKRSDAQRAYSDWLEIQKQVLNGNTDFSHVERELDFETGETVYGTEFTFSSDSSTARYGLRNDGSIVSPVLPQADAQSVLTVTASCGGESIKITVPVTVTALAPDAVPYVSGQKGEMTSGTVNLTEEGTVDWAQFCTSDVGDYARKEQETAKIKNLKVLDSVDKKVTDAAFSFEAADGTKKPENSTAISARGLGDGFTFELPYSEKMQRAKIYANVWGGDATLEVLVNGAVLYSGTFGKDSSSGMLGQDFEIAYKVPSIEDKVMVKLYCTSDLGEWGGCVTALQAVTVRETEENVPAPEPVDTQVMVTQDAQPEKVNVTEEGSADWKLFTSTNLEQIERKAGGQGIVNLSPIQAVTKMNPNASVAEFSYTDGTQGKTGKYSKGIVFEKAGNGIRFDLPYSERRQEARIYLGAWSAQVKISVSVVKDEEAIKEYDEYFDTGAQAGGTPAKYSRVSINYLLDDPETSLHVEVSNDTLYDTQWGNMNLGAITLKSSFRVNAEETAHGTIIVTNPIASAGEKVTVFAVPDEGCQLAEGSLRYYLEGDTAGIRLEGESFIMPMGNVTVRAEFSEKTNVKDDVGLTGRELLEVAYHAYTNLAVSAYTEESAEALTDALKAGKRVLDNEDSTGEEIKKAVSDILTAAAGLVPDTTDLSAAVKAAADAADAANKVAQQALTEAAENKTAAETAQAAADAAKQAADAAKQAADAAREEAEANKEAAELAQQAADEAQKKAEEAEQAAKEAKEELEKAQQAAKEELEKVQQEAKEELEKAQQAVKAELEKAQKEAEAQKAELEKLAAQAEAAQKAAEEARAEAEAAQKAALEAKQAYEKAQQSSGTQQPGTQESAVQIVEGQTYDSGDYSYKVTSVEKQTAEVVGIKNTSLTKITVYNSVTLGGKSYKVTSVNASAFKGNKKVTSAVIGKNVITIGSSAFSGCTKLKKVTVKSTALTQIGGKAFLNCKNLKNITIKSKSLKKVGANAFRGISAKAVIKVPAAKYKAYAKLLAKKGQGKTVKIKK